MNVMPIIKKEKMTLFRNLVIICLISPLSFVATTENSKSNSDINRYLESIYSDNAPGAAVLVIKNGQKYLEGFYGLANIHDRKQIETGLVFRIGSLTKQFTAAGIVLLEERGHIKLSETIDQYLPHQITNGDKITIENLLTHTSGIADFDSLEGTMMETADRSLDLTEIIRFFANKPSQFNPGEKYQYSNPGYILLGAIIEKVSGKTYSQFIHDEILIPNNMKKTYFSSLNLTSNEMVQGYHREDTTIVKAYEFNADIPYSAGGMLSTIHDIEKWNTALWSGKVVSLKSLEKMITPFVLNNGTETEYGYGLETLNINGQKLITHQGGIFGFQSVLTTIPEEDIQIVIMTNTDNPDVWPNEVTEKIIEMMLKES